jgi:hypothetical protein
MWLLAAVIAYFVLRLLHGASNLNVFESEQLQALAKLRDLTRLEWLSG